MVMAGCPNSDGNSPSETPSGTTTYTVTFNSDGGSDVAQITGLKSGDLVTRPTNPKKAGYGFGGWFKEEALTTQWIFSTDTVNGNITLHAKWIPAAQDATIASILINGQNLEDVDNASFGEPDEDLAHVGAGTFEPGISYPATGVTIAVTANQTAATVKWVIKATDPTEAEFTASTNPATPQQFAENQKLYIKITNGSNTLYYKINVYFAVTGKIYYGRPDLRGSNNEAVDPLWEANYQGPVFSISRNNTSEISTPPYRFSHTVKEGENHTKGTAKVYWDDEGLYVYATITYNDFYEDEAAKTAGTSTARVTHMRGTYESDSLEIMINPRYQELPGAVDRAQQYRVGFSKGDSDVVNDTWTNGYGTFTIGGNFRANPDPFAANFTRYAFAQTGKYNAWITKDAANKETGYKVICRVPWFLIGYTATNNVFDNTTGKVKTVGTDQGPKIGLEFQINARITEDTARDATLTCNTVALQALTNVTNWAVVDLIEGAGKTRVTEAHYPSIATQPRINKDEPANNKTAISVDTVVGPTVPVAALSYKWYQADNATVAGTEIANTNNRIYTPADPTAATGKFFYVVVTNTNSAATAGFTTASVTSRRLQYTPLVETVDDLVIDNPTITKIGNTADGVNGVFTLNTGNGDQGITYQFPANLNSAYKTIQIFYDVAKVPTTDTKPMKLTVKQGYNNFDDIAGGGQYKDITNPGVGSFTFTLATAFTTKKDGFTFQMNTYQDGSCSYTIKITKVVFSAN